MITDIKIDHERLSWESSHAVTLSLSHTVSIVRVLILSLRDIRLIYKNLHVSDFEVVIQSCSVHISIYTHSQEHNNITISSNICGPGSSVGTATELRAGLSGIESRWGRDFPPVQTGPGTHPASCKMGTGSFSGVKCGRGVLLITHHLLMPRSWKSRTIPLPTLWATSGL